jgi:hypothetical protein
MHANVAGSETTLRLVDKFTDTLDRVATAERRHMLGW